MCDVHKHIQNDGRKGLAPSSARPKYVMSMITVHI